MPAPTDPPSFLSRRWPVLLAGLVLVAGGAAGVWLARDRSPPPAAATPPDVPEGAPLEPAVASAIKATRARVLKDPQSAAAWGRLGKVFLANELEPESRACFAEAERLEPGNPRWPFYQAVPLVNQGDRETAIPYLQRAADCCVAAGEDDTPTRLALAEALLALGRAADAESHIRRVLDSQPDNARARFDAGLLAVEREEWGAARDHLLRCVNAPFARRRARVQLAAVCRRLGDVVKAEEYQKEADRLPADSEWPDPLVTEYLQEGVKKKGRYKLAEYLEGSGHFADAARVLQPLVQDYPDDYLPHLALGKVLAQMGQIRPAETELRLALKLAPDKVQAHQYLSMLLFNKGEALARQGKSHRPEAEAAFREAEKLAGEALAQKPDYGVAHMARGLALKGLGKNAEAVRELEAAVRCNPEHAELHLRLAEMLADAGRTREAVQRFEQALRLAPPGAPWRAGVEARLAELRKSPEGKKQAAPEK